MYKFDHDWFSNNIPQLQKIFAGYNGNNPRILEIGAFEGKSTVWFLENISNCTVTTIDTWLGGKDHSPDNPEINFSDVKRNFEHNIRLFSDRLDVIESKSFNALLYMINRETEKFDFVYVDGSHTAIDVHMDLCLSFELLKVGGLLYCDDYFWGFNEFSVYDSPKLGIDSFVNVYGNKLRPLIGLSNAVAVYMKTED
jgi:predicted O-methyltransferase YrrM